MAAIAARQGRSNDALGWYGKVLEAEPRNNVAQAAMVSVMAQADPIGSESRIKNLLAQQPEAGYLHAALGGMYAGQNQWPLAQQSYFQALHFDAKNAEYAFNLAVSLDHLGKTAVALQYYKTTLELQSKSGIGNIDRTQVESRIAQLE
jgi:tetratricopeptide (TPR) repeat protein